MSGESRQDDPGRVAEPPVGIEGHRERLDEARRLVRVEAVLPPQAEDVERRFLPV
jgi:hypothetical protein